MRFLTKKKIIRFNIYAILRMLWDVEKIFAMRQEERL